MATILLAWELGGGLTHLMNLRPLMEELPRRGHRVIAVMRDLSSAQKALGGAKVEYLQAPFRQQNVRLIEPTCTFAQVIHNCGFAETDELATLAGAWRSLYEYVKPDLIVCEHSPMALMATARFTRPEGRNRRRFFCSARRGAPHQSAQLDRTQRRRATSA